MSTDTPHFSPLDPTYAELGNEIRQFVIDRCIPREPEWKATGKEVSDELRLELVAEAKAAGIYGPHLPKEYGGREISHRGSAVAFEAAGYSMLGAVSIHCNAPDEGNQHLLNKVATAAQRDEFLKPLCEGARSCFMMTEPGGAGADPSQMISRAIRDGDDYLISGRKWYITGAVGSKFSIIMARDGDAEDAPPSMFLVPTDAPGINIIKEMDVMAHDTPGGHCQIELDNVRVHKDNVLGEAGKGFQYAQVRLAPARLTHCMRWLGAAQRCHDTALHHAGHRTSFGKRLGEHQGVGFMLADNEIDLHTARISIDHAAAILDSGAKGRHETSMVKVYVSEALSRVVDRSMQILGGLGVTGYTPVEHIYRSIRAFRIYDGPSEVHRFAIAGRVLPGENEANRIEIDWTKEHE